MFELFGRSILDFRSSDLFYFGYCILKNNHNFDSLTTVLVTNSSYQFILSYEYCKSKFNIVLSNITRELIK